LGGTSAEKGNARKKKSRGRGVEQSKCQTLNVPWPIALLESGDRRVFHATTRIREGRKSEKLKRTDIGWKKEKNNKEEKIPAGVRTSMSA